MPVLRHLPCLIILALTGCGGGSGGAPPPAPLTGWAAVRAQAAPVVALPAEFDAPMVQPIAVDGWEDGIHISRDGLHLYAVYAPCDLLTFVVTDGAPQANAAAYFRGPTLGMDLVTSPAATANWIHGNIIHASRTSTALPFSPWTLTTMARPIWSEGAPNPQGSTGTGWDIFAYTSNEHATDYKAHICIARNTAYDPAALGAMLPAPVTTSTTEDNPHIERLSASDLVLFFDSDNRPGGTGGLDIWLTTSGNDGASWTTPVPLTSVNTALAEHQPHLFHSSTGTWWLYFSASNPLDGGKLGIYRAAQTTPGDWLHWNTRELVVGAGNTEGVGEPTLTSNGDLSFVAVIQDTVNGTAKNRYDADPWFLPRRPGSVAGSGTQHAAQAAAILNPP